MYKPDHNPESTLLRSSWTGVETLFISILTHAVNNCCISAFNRCLSLLFSFAGIFPSCSSFFVVSVSTLWATVRRPGCVSARIHQHICVTPWLWLPLHLHIQIYGRSNVHSNNCFCPQLFLILSVCWTKREKKGRSVPLIVREETKWSQITFLADDFKKIPFH